MHINGSGNVYMDLFNSIYNMGEYDKLLLPGKFKIKKNDHQLPAYTNYLFTNILDALKNYNARKSIDSEISHLLNETDLLFSKGLYAEAQKIIYKAKALANTFERWVLLLEAIDLEEKLARSNKFPTALGTMIKNSHAERIKTLDKIKVSAEYNWLHNRIAQVVYKISRYGKRKMDQTEMEKVMRHPLLTNENNAITLSDKYTFYFIHALYHYYKLKPDFKIYILFTLKRKKLLENKTEWASQDSGRYLAVIQNLESHYTHTYNTKGCDKLIEDLQKMPDLFGERIQEKDEARRRAMLQGIQIERCLISGTFDIWSKKLKGKEAEWEKVFAKVGRMDVLVFYDNMRLLFFATKDYKRALMYNNMVNNDHLSKQVPDLYATSIIWDIIIHFELKNFKLADIRTKQAFHILKDIDKLNGFEKIFLTNIQTVLTAKKEGKQRIKKYFFDFQKKLFKLKRNSGEALKLEHISCIAWVSAHAEQKSYAFEYRKYLNLRVSDHAV